MGLILVVDDDAEYARALSKRLQSIGLDAVCVDSGRAALEYCGARRPDLIFLDWCLGPGISGRSTLGFLKKAPQTRAIPVIVMSGLRLQPDDEKSAISAGARYFFAKGEIGDSSASGASLERHVRALLPAFGQPRSVSPSASSEGRAFPDIGQDGSNTAGLEVDEGTQSNFPVAPTILVIDDQEETAELLSHLFKDAGYQIQWANSGKQGLSRVSTEFPDLVVLDLHMPDLDGRQICRALREKSPDGSLYLPILMFTGDGRSNHEVQCLNLGADDYLIKPAPNDLVLARINGLLRRTRFLIDTQGKVSIGNVALNCRTHEFCIAGEPSPIRLTKAEAGIMLLLMSARGRPVDQRLLHKKICRSSTIPDPRSSTIKSHISHIRAKLGRHAALIGAVNGEAAYRFDSDEGAVNLRS